MYSYPLNQRKIKDNTEKCNFRLPYYNQKGKPTTRSNSELNSKFYIFRFICF